MKVLVANRGEIACRVISTCEQLGVETVALYTRDDALAPHCTSATAAVYLGKDPRQYTAQEAVLQVSRNYSLQQRKA